MKKRYGIGLFVFIFLFLACLGTGYQLSYQMMMDRQETRLAEKEAKDSVTTKGTARKNDGYYIMELHGYAAVYLSDKETLYETTEIYLENLPVDIKAEVRVGKFVKSEKELYAFLENYSS